MSPQISFGYKAVRPFPAEHPVGSGEVVRYEPGDDVPAGDWGRAADMLVESGKIMRYATNVYEPGELAADAPPSEVSAEEPDASDGDVADLSSPEYDRVDFPVNRGRGQYVLSDGTKVRGKEAAEAAQAELDVPADEDEEGAA